MAAKKKEVKGSKCLCGCGGTAKKLFLQGHDMTLRSAVVTAFKNESTFRANKAQAEYLKSAHWVTPEIRKVIKAA